MVSTLNHGLRLAQVLALASGLIAIGAAAVTAQPAGEGGSLPLTELLDLAKPYPNLLFEVRAELVRANLKKEDVVCSGLRFPRDWIQLGGARRAPYACAIGGRTLVVTARQTLFDGNGHKLGFEDPKAKKRASKLVETGLKWRWR